MTITITQTCDGAECGESRSLNVGYYGGLPSIKRAADAGGWRDVQEFKHLCPACIRKAVSA